MSGSTCRAWLWAIAVSCIALAASGEEATSISGKLSVELEGLALSDAGEIVVFLEPQDGAVSSANDAARPATVRQRGASFDPEFLAVSVGQRVDMPNDDIIFHNVFSYSEPNDFDLGLYAAGKSQSIEFEHAGLVRIYCSIHESMDGLIFVAPTHLFDIPDISGRYEISGVGPGRYRIHVWSERLPEVVQAVTVSDEGAMKLDFELGLVGD
jgi:plastocyanin